MATAKTFFVWLLALSFVLLSSLNVSADSSVFLKEVTETEKERYKTENEENGEFQSVFHLKKSKLEKKAPPPDDVPTSTVGFLNARFAKTYAAYIFEVKRNANVCFSHLFGHAPRYIVFHALVFYEA